VSRSEEKALAQEYRLAELATRTGVAPRTIRYYQSKGVLARPRRRGRDGFYDDGHVERLQLIAELQGRGLTLGAIRQFLHRDRRSVLSVGEWLGLDDTLQGPWSEDRPRLVDATGLAEHVDGIDEAPELVTELERAGFLERQEGADAAWLVPSPALLDLAVRLRDAGVDVEVSGQARDLLRRRLARASDDLVALFFARTGAGFAGRGRLPDVAAAVAALRPIAAEAAGVVLAQEIERALERARRVGAPRSRHRRAAPRRR
jgi:DNA-binding transcriptional MerR regulator